MQITGLHWDKDTILAIAKKTWSGFKNSHDASVNPEKKKKKINFFTKKIAEGCDAWRYILIFISETDN